MKYAILSDVHANLEAFERILGDAARCGADQIICLGDVVGYGPLPVETLKRVRETADVVLVGNHDAAVSGRLDTAGFIGLAGDAVCRHRKTLAREDLAWLKALPYTAEIEGAVLAHGDLTAPEEFRYIDAEDCAAANFAATDATLVFVGHTHVPGIYLTGGSGRVYTLGAEDFIREDGKRYIVNVGSVGYPRVADGKCLSSYVMYDSDEGTVRFRFIAFSVASVLQRGRAAGKRKLVLGLAGAVLLTAGALAFLLTKENAPALPPPVLEQTLLLDDSVQNIRANMKLAESSPNAVLTIAFSSARGRELEPVVFTGKSSTKKFKVPHGAVKARLTIRPATNGQMPVVKEFAPSAE